MYAQAPAVQNLAPQHPTTPTAPPKAAAQASKVDAAKINPTKEADIRSLVELTGARESSAQLLQLSLGQIRASLDQSLPPGEKSKKFAEAFMQKFQERFSLDVLMERIVPIYDKYLTEEDVKGLLKFYGSPVGQRMLKVQPQIGKEAQAIGFEMAQTVGKDVLNELKAEYPELVPSEKP
jgi:hypothetical protein